MEIPETTHSTEEMALTYLKNRETTALKLIFPSIDVSRSDVKKCDPRFELEETANGEVKKFKKYGSWVVRTSGNEDLEKVKALVGNNINIAERVISGASTTGQGPTVEQLVLADQFRGEILQGLQGKEKIDYLKRLNKKQFREILELKGLKPETKIVEEQRETDLEQADFKAISAPDGTSLEKIATIVAIKKAKKINGRVKVIVPSPDLSGSKSGYSAIMELDTNKSLKDRNYSNEHNGVKLTFEEAKETDGELFNQVINAINADEVVRLSMISVNKNGGSIGSPELINKLRNELGEKFDTQLVIELDNCQGRILTKEFSNLIDEGIILIDTASKADGLPMYLGHAYLNKTVAELIKDEVNLLSKCGCDCYGFESVKETVLENNIPQMISRIIKRQLMIEGMKKQAEAGLYEGTIPLVTRVINRAVESRLQELELTRVKLLDGGNNPFLSKNWEGDHSDLNSILMLSVKGKTKEELKALNKQLGDGEIPINMGQPTRRGGEVGLRYGLDWWRISNLILEAEELNMENIEDILNPVVEEVITCAKKLEELTELKSS